jgi:protein ImuB
LVTAARIGNRHLVIAVDAAASAAGLGPGLPLADARARLPEVAVAEADPVGDALALAGLADWCGRYTPWTQTDGADGVWLDITGCTPLFASEAGLATDLVGRLRRLGISAQAAVADTPGAAWAVARYVRADQGLPVIVPSGRERASLAELPVAGLRLPAEIVQDLGRLGLVRIGDLYPLPRAPLAPRFGMIVARRLDQALGLAAEPISPAIPVERHRVRRDFAEPISTAEDIAATLVDLLDRLCRRLGAEHRGARRLELACYRVDARVERVEIGTSRPVRDPAHLMRLFVERLERIDPGLGIEVVELGAPVVEPLAPNQLELGQLDLDRLESGAGSAADRLAPIVDRLVNRLGAANVTRLDPVESHLPERAQRAVPALAMSEMMGARQDRIEAWLPGQRRPIRLLPRPDRIDVTAPVPDDPPLSFRWRGVVHRVSRAEGPERIAPEWWHTATAEPGAGIGALRDYYRVEDKEGRRYWLYRDGLYQENTAPRWFLHGFFA